MATSLLLLPGMETELRWFEVTNLPNQLNLLVQAGGRRRKESCCTTGKWGDGGHSKKVHSSGHTALVFNSLFSLVFLFAENNTEGWDIR